MKNIIFYSSRTVYQGVVLRIDLQYFGNKKLIENKLFINFKSKSTYNQYIPERLFVGV